MKYEGQRALVFSASRVISDIVLRTPGICPGRVVRQTKPRQRVLALGGLAALASRHARSSGGFGYFAPGGDRVGRDLQSPRAGPAGALSGRGMEYPRR